MDLERIESLLKLMQEYRVAELGIEEEGTAVHLSLMHDGAQIVAAPPPVGHAPMAAPATAETPAAAPDSNLHEVNSPMVGTFYRAAKPGSPPYVKVGDRIDKGHCLCIVEAMKLMNELESEIAGTVREVLVEDAQPVQFGQALFRIEPD